MRGYDDGGDSALDAAAASVGPLRRRVVRRDALPCVQEIFTLSCLRSSAASSPLLAVAGYGDMASAQPAGESFVAFVDADSGEMVNAVAAHTSAVQHVEFAHARPLVASGSNDATASFIDVQACKLLATVRDVHRGWVNQVRFRYDDTMVLCCSNDGQFSVVDTRTWRTAFDCSRTDSTDDLRGGTWSPDGMRFVVAGNDGCMREYDVRNVAAGATWMHFLEDGHDRLNSVDWAGDMLLVSSSRFSGLTAAFDTRSRRMVHCSTQHGGRFVGKVLWCPQGGLPVYASVGGDERTTLHCLQDDTAHLVCEMDGGHAQWWRQCIDWNATGDTLYSATTDTIEAVSGIHTRWSHRSHALHNSGFRAIVHTLLMLGGDYDAFPSDMHSALSELPHDVLMLIVDELAGMEALPRTAQASVPALSVNGRELGELHDARDTLRRLNEVEEAIRSIPNPPPRYVAMLPQVAHQKLVAEGRIRKLEYLLSKRQADVAAASDPSVVAAPSHAADSDADADADDDGDDSDDDNFYGSGSNDDDDDDDDDDDAS